MKRHLRQSVKVFMAWSLMCLLHIGNAYAQSEYTTLYGCMASDKHGAGLFSFTTAKPGFTPIKLENGLKALGGGTLAEHKFFSINADDPQNRRLYIYDADTWELLDDNPVENPAVDLTYDPVLKKVYGCFTKGQTVMLGTIDEKGKQQTIANMDVLPSALFCDREGQLMIIGQDGILYKLDKQTAKTEKVGETGIMPFFVQSATVDPNTGKCFWTSMTQEGSGLQEVDLSTGKAKQIYAFENVEEIVGLFIPIVAKVTAPAMIDDIMLQFDGGSLTGKVVFNMPSKTKGGAAIAGKLAYKLMVNDKVYEGKAVAGSQVVIDMTLTEGNKKLVLVTTNAAGEESDRAVKVMWAGQDAPAAVTGVKLHKETPERVRLSWSASTEGKHKGYVDPSAITYKIVRYPDQVTLHENFKETTLTDNLAPTELVKYWYTIMPTTNGKQGEETLSNKVIMGPSYETPYKESFATQESFEKYTVEDCNKDGITWGYNIYGNYVEYSGIKKGDDWLISPPVKLEKRGYYKLSFNVRCLSANVHQLSVFAGSLPDTESMKQQLVPTTEFKTDFMDKLVEQKFMVDNDGDRYFGFHTTGELGAPVTLNQICVERVSSIDAPASVSDLKLVAGEKGAQKVFVSFKAPVKTIGGSQLTAIDRVELFRLTENGEKKINTFTSVKPGASLEFTDNEPALKENTYRVVAYNTEEAGDDIIATVYVGKDVPGKVSNIRLKEVGNAIVEISWDAPTKGVHDGYIDVSKLTYHVKRNGSLLVGGKPASSLHVTDSINDLGADQFFVGYEVVALSEAGMGQGVISPFLTVGAPYDVPFKESFVNGKGAKGWGNNADKEGVSWSARMTSAEDSQDGDKGIISLVPYMPDNGKTELLSPKIAIGKSVHPKLSFWLRHTAIDESLKVVIYSADRKEHQMREIKLNENPDEWQNYVIDLGEYRNEEFIQIGLQAFNLPVRSKIDMDNLSVFDDLKRNLGISEINVPQRVRVGEQGEVVITVSNQGTEKVNAFTVELYDKDNKLIASSNGAGIEPEGTQKVNLIVIPQAKDLYEMMVTAVVNCQGDQNLSNNSKTGKFAVVPLSYPAPTELTGMKNGTNVKLSWKAPDLTKPYYETTFESFEDYPSFTVSDLGEWSMIDADAKEYTMQFRTSDGRWIDYENCAGPMAFQLIDLSQIIGTEDEGWSSASGKKILISVYSSGGGNDDWLISPELTTEAQTISVCAKSLNYERSGLESMEILYSETDKQAESFKLLKQVSEIPTQWTEYKFDLPKGAKYFAIHSKKANSALMIDDIRYVKAGTQQVTLDLQGYNIYRDGEKRNEALLSALTFVDNNIEEDKTYNYFVTAVYAQGESDFSNVYQQSATSSVENIAGGNTSVSVRSADGQIIVKGLNGQQVSLYTLSGTKLYTTSGKEKLTLQVPDGVYIVRIDQSSYKVIVK